MRNAFADEITKLAIEDSRIVLLSGDIGNRLFDEMRTQIPPQFINCGVAESNMIGVAAGMALSGLRPVTYTIAPFTTTRCLEQIRVDVAYHEAPVIIVGTGAGLSYASLGPTHHSLEDFAILRAIPNMRILAPWDAPSLRYVLRQSLLDLTPTYIRIGKKGEPVLHPISKVSRIGRMTRVVTGDDIAIVAAGTIANEAVAAAEQLKNEGIIVSLVLTHTIKPLPEMDLRELFKSHRQIIIVEEHSTAAGFGESCVSFAHRERYAGQVVPLGTPDLFLEKLGSHQHARVRAGLDAAAIAAAVRAVISVIE